MIMFYRNYVRRIVLFVAEKRLRSQGVSARNEQVAALPNSAFASFLKFRSIVVRGEFVVKV